jgi:hypothetical protein
MISLKKRRERELKIILFCVTNGELVVNVVVTFLCQGLVKGVTSSLPTGKIGGRVVKGKREINADCALMMVCNLRNMRQILQNSVCSDDGTPPD